MFQNWHSTAAPPRPWATSALVVDGLVTLLACAFALPIGIALIVANAGAALIARGRLRLAFVGIATAGAAVSTTLLLLLAAGAVTAEVGPVLPL